MNFKFSPFLFVMQVNVNLWAWHIVGDKQRNRYHATEKQKQEQV